ncbi:PD-(D/E)XK nuclease family protein [Lutimonas sp.]|uniref:PD-(D/E)XK nuclease family protein n=1 Tax=Lutimonas sp. TaxID=1872403 RepID=UPI003D9B9A7D
MQSFLSKVVSQVLKSNPTLSNITFVLPNKRAGIFLKTILKTQLNKATFLPRILSIEEFIKEVSGFDILDNVNLLFEFYGIYKTHTQKDETESFESFSKWASILIQDFNDLDSNLFDTASILGYLSETKRIEQWYPDEPHASTMVQKYLSFFEKIITYHDAFQKHLINKHSGYQGLVYRMVIERLDTYKKLNPNQKFVFAAFNALNKAEETIIQNLLIDKQATIYWDHDEFYEKTNNQSAQFFQKYQRSWPYYVSNDFEWKHSNINTSKIIHFHGVPKNVSQIKHVGSLLKDLQKNGQIDDTAVILGNEKLLPSLLNSMPSEISKANITMGYELQNISLSSFFQALFNLHLNKSKRKGEKTYYYKDVNNLLNDPFFKAQWIQFEAIEKGLKSIMYSDKTIFISESKILDLVYQNDKINRLFTLIFTGWEADINMILTQVIEIIDILRKGTEQNKLHIEYLYRYHDIFVQLSNLNKNYGFIDSINSLYQLFQQLLKTEKLSFKGEPLEGLQIMGLLESRGLDFKNVIITSVNEGFLPASGTNNSFIPMDIKLEKKIPTYFEQDAIFSFHFFRLLHRAENVYLIYNNITDDFGAGEPSRFIRQLEIAKSLGQLNHVTFEKKTINPHLQSDPDSLKSITKNDAVLLRLKEVAKKGFSPSSLTNYIRNPIDFYKRSILRIEEFKEVEETIAANTFGTIIHDTLEHLYTPYLNKTLQEEDISAMIDKAATQVNNEFAKSFSLSSIASGKNYLAFEIAQQFVHNFLQFELSELKRGKKIKILGLETAIEMEHSINGLETNVKLRGKIDRIDEIDGSLRIMDYKTGKVSPNQLKIKDWSLLGQDEKYSKSFQVLCYAYMYANGTTESLDKLLLQSGIVSFKNLKEGFMPFNGAYITDDILESFVFELDRLILDLFDKEINFEEKEIAGFKY